MKNSIAVLAAIAGLLTSGSATAPEIDCYDLSVFATPVAQVPTRFPESDEYTVIRWPWIVDLQFERLVDGVLEDERMTIVASLHGRLPEARRTFLLRRNHLGGYNLLRPSDPDSLQKCLVDLEPVQAMIVPANGQSFEEYRAELEAYYRSFEHEEGN